MNRFFNSTVKFNKHLYIVDYTEQTKNMSIKRGVEFHTSKPNDISGLEIVNGNSVEFWAVNFEDVALLDDEGKKIKQCECMCAAIKNDTDKGWLLLAELKYGLSKNDNSNFNYAYKQIESTHKYLCEKGVVNNHRIYYIISLPNSDKTPPFERFKYPPHKLAELKRNTGITLRGTNMVEVRNSTRLKV